MQRNSTLWKKAIKILSPSHAKKRSRRRKKKPRGVHSANSHKKDPFFMPRPINQKREKKRSLSSFFWEEQAGGFYWGGAHLTQQRVRKKVPFKNWEKSIVVLQSRSWLRKSSKIHFRNFFLVNWARLFFSTWAKKERNIALIIIPSGAHHFEKLRIFFFFYGFLLRENSVSRSVSQSNLTSFLFSPPEIDLNLSTLAPVCSIVGLSTEDPSISPI